MGRAQLARVLFVVKEDVAPDPIDVGLFCAVRVVFPADGVPQLIQQSLGFLEWLIAHNIIDLLIPSEN